jgi:hypothetical protein
MIELVAVSWLFLVLATLVGWAGFGAHRRGVEGTDLPVHRDGLDL